MKNTNPIFSLTNYRFIANEVAGFELSHIVKLARYYR